MINNTNPIIRHRAGLLNLAEELGNVMDHLSNSRTLIELASARAQETPDRVYMTYLLEGRVAGPTETRSYGMLDQRARAIAAQIQKSHVSTTRVLLAYPSGVAFIDAFLGVLYAGMIISPCFAVHHRAFIPDGFHCS